MLVRSGRALIEPSRTDYVKVGAIRVGFRHSASGVAACLFFWQLLLVVVYSIHNVRGLRVATRDGK